MGDLEPLLHSALLLLIRSGNYRVGPGSLQYGSAERPLEPSEDSWERLQSEQAPSRDILGHLRLGDKAVEFL